MGTTRRNQALQALRNLNSPLRKFREIAGSLKKGIREIQEQIPSYWPLWAPIFRKFKFQVLLGWGDLIMITRPLETFDVLTPLELVAHTKASIAKLADKVAEPPGVESVWMAVKCFAGDAGWGGRHISMRSHNNAMELITELRSKLQEDAPIAKRRTALLRGLGLPANFESLTPLAKTNALATCGAPEHLISEFLDTSDRINILRSVQGSLRSVASGVNSYLRFCNLLSIPPFPVSTACASRWSACFNPGETYAQYTCRIRKACILLQHSTGWFTEEIKTIYRGLRNAQGRSFASPNFLMSGGLLEIITYEGQFAPMAAVAYLSYLFPLRVPSEAIRLEKADRFDKLLTFEPQQAKSLIGVETLRQTPVLAIKFRFRKDIRW